MKSLTEAQAKAARQIVPRAQVRPKKLARSQIFQMLNALKEQGLNYAQTAQILRSQGYVSPLGKIISSKFLMNLKHALVENELPDLPEREQAKLDAELGLMLDIIECNLQLDTKRALLKQFSAQL